MYISIQSVDFGTPRKEAGSLFFDVEFESALTTGHAAIRLASDDLSLLVFRRVSASTPR